MKVYNKLVRDKIPEIIRADKKIPVCKTLDDDNYFKELNKKLLEEIDEYLKSSDTEELADVVEVIYAILEYKKVTKDEFEKIRIEKFNNRGGFNKRIFLEKVDNDE